jgi:hypothetical protein
VNVHLIKKCWKPLERIHPFIGVEHVQNKIQKITTNLWFDHEAEEAAKLYTSIFKKSSTTRITRYGNESIKVVLKERS